VSVKNKGNALKNPYAQDGRNVSVEDVMNSACLASPIKELDRSPSSDGACALILANEEKAKAWTKNPVWIAGAGTANDLFYFGDRNLKELSSLKEAARKGYEMAGIRDPRQEIDVAEVSESYSYLEPMICEGLGLCGPGEGIRLLEAGVTAMSGELPVNPSGGMLGGCPEIVAGLNAVVEVAGQLAGRAGDHQLDEPKVGLVHGKNGFAAQQNTVVILKNSY
jgi:acetyl-CoA C-acetyltransferase